MLRNHTKFITGSSSYIIEEELRNLHNYESSFVVCEHEQPPYDLLQACLYEEKCFHVEYVKVKDKCAGEVNNVNLEAAIELFQNYAEGGSSWLHTVAWKDASHPWDWNYLQSEECHRHQQRCLVQIYSDLALIEPKTPSSSALLPDAALPEMNGVIYLLKAGPFYKIGRTQNIDQRLKQIKLQLPYPVELIHTIQTDDTNGIERYWHRRFAQKRTNGEWFLLTDEDVHMFKSRTNM